MTILDIVKIICAVGTIGVGVLSAVNPTGIHNFTGLDVAGNPRGITEVRSVLGGFFIALGLAPLIWYAQREPMYLMLGFTYLVVAGVRLISMLLDKSVMQSNIISLVVEIIFGVLLVL